MLTPEERERARQEGQRLAERAATYIIVGIALLLAYWSLWIMVPR